MPYSRLPARLRQMIPAQHGQDLFRNVFNSQLKSGKTESVAFASAWAALQNAGYSKTNGQWVKKSSGAKPLYMKRKVLNAERIVEWARNNGIPTTLDPDDMHVTVIYSKEPFNEEYTRAAEMQDEHPMYYGGHVVRGGKRSVERLGQNGEALVLKIECPKLASEHYAFRAMGASSDWPDYKPHITLSWKAEGIDEKGIKPFDGDIVLSDIFVSLLDENWKSKVMEKSSDSMLQNKLDEWNEKYAEKHGKITLGMLRDVYDRGVGAYRTNPESVRPNVNSPEQWAAARVNSFLSAARGAKSINHDKDIHDKIKKSSPTASSVHVPSAEWEKAETYKAPASARNNAARVLRWKEKYGDEVKGMTSVGWTRARQLANNENLSRETVARMSAFARHRKNAEIDPKYKDTPWKDRGYVAWLGWGGDTGISWAKSIMERINKRQIDDDTFTMPDEARMRSMELGLGGAIHVSSEDGQQAVYMPGASHEDYLEMLNRIAGIEPEEDDEEEPVNEGLIERAISAIIGAIMQHTDVNKSFEETKILKVDDEQRIVYGWASVVTEDGEPVVDSQGDVIEPEEMVKMANDFMLAVRTAKAMHKGDKIGEVIHSMPLTAELAKALGLHTDMEGWIVGVKVYSDDVWASVKSGEFAGFSIGGRASSREKMA